MQTHCSLASRARRARSAADVTTTASLAQDRYRGGQPVVTRGRLSNRTKLIVFVSPLGDPHTGGRGPQEHTDAVDEDLDRMTREQLGAEVVKLRAAIRRHRDSSGHDLCWHHPDVWATLPEHIDPDLAVPPWPKFIRGCIAYRQSLDEQLPGARTHDAEYDEQPR